MTYVEPLPDTSAAVATVAGDRILLIADYHAGIETAIRKERGVQVPDRSENRRRRLLEAFDRAAADRLLVLGDLMHSIGGPESSERDEIEALLDALDGIDVTLIKGNHDGAIESWAENVTVTETTGTRLGPIGAVHGHTWPSKAVLEADVVCMGHEHPQVRLEDEVGGSRVERVWLRGTLRRYPFAERIADLEWRRPQFVVVPAFNELVGGTWVNVEGQEFLAPWFPQAIDHADAYLLDGTRLGQYRTA